MEELKIRRKSLLTRLGESKTLVIEAEQTLNRLKNQHMEIKQKYSEIDREIAMQTRTILPPQGTRQPKAPKMTMEQIKKVAEHLGIEIKED